MTKSEATLAEIDGVTETERDRLINLASQTNDRLIEFVDRVTAALNSPVLGLSITAQRRITSAADGLKESISAAVTLHGRFPSDFIQDEAVGIPAEPKAIENNAGSEESKPADKTAPQKPADKLV